MHTLSWEWLDNLQRQKWAWGPGPWQEECDKHQWPDPGGGMPCLAVRSSVTGAWCGYVGLEPGHPFYGLHYAQCALRPTPCHKDGCEHTPAALLKVHGGLTYSGGCAEDDDDQAYGICHVPGPGEEVHLWWFGWDAAHGRDVMPAWPTMPTIPVGEGYSISSYKTLAYVRQECARLALQLDDRDWEERLAALREQRHAHAQGGKR